MHLQRCIYVLFGKHDAVFIIEFRNWIVFKTDQQLIPVW
jgi:hypothetical protein